MPIALFPPVILTSDQPTRNVPCRDGLRRPVARSTPTAPAPKAFDDVDAGLVGVRSNSVPRYRHGEELGRRAPTALRHSTAWGGSALGVSSGGSILAAG